MATILLIEDDPRLRAVVMRALQNSGHTVVAAENGRDGLASHAAGPVAFDLVVCDLILPELGGFETIRTLQARSPQLPILVMSGAPHAMHYLEAEAGWERRVYLGKPFDLPVFMAAVDRLLSEAASPR
jgi:DNA-binding response OmpR family regulator